MCDHHLPGKVCIPDPAHVELDGTGVPVISLDANNGDVFIGGPPGGFGHRGRLVLTNADGEQTYEIDGATGTTSQSGDIVLLDTDGNERVRISGQTAEVIIRNAAGDQIVHLDGKVGDLTLGGTGQKGDLIVRNSTGNETIHLDGHQAEVIAGGNGRNGDVIVRTSADGDVIQLKGDTGEALVGGNGAHGHVVVRDSGDSETIRLDGNTGNVTLNGEIVIKDWSITVPDYVFSEDYKPRELDELARYVGANHHLPDIPSAEEVAREGVNVGEFCMLLLKKVEEMSLYAIQQDRLIRQQGARLAKLEQRSSA